MLKHLRLKSFFSCLIYIISPCTSWADEFERPPQLSSHNSQTSQKTVKLAIIIDDLGNSLRSGLDAISLPGQISFAVMPHRKHSQTLAERAGRLGRDVLLHAPMATQAGRELGSGALHLDLGEKAFKDKLRFAINSIPYIKGVNNHMGSLLTTQHVAMTWVMEVVQEQPLFFVDSRTHGTSVAFETAQSFGLPSAQRDVFLDHKISIEHIHIQFKKALAIAKQYGSAITIGHPHKETLIYLKHVLPQLAANHVELVPVSQLVKAQLAPRPDKVRESAPLAAPDLDQLIHSLRTDNPSTEPQVY